MTNNCLHNLTHKLTLVDTHAHLHSEAYDDTSVLSKALQSAVFAGLGEIWLMSLDQTSFARNLEVIDFAKRRYPELKLRLAAGFDMEILVPGSDLFDIRWFQSEPDELEFRTQALLGQMQEQAAERGLTIDLVGEVGLDHFRLMQQPYTDLAASEITRSQELQQHLLKVQLEFAAKNKIPVSLHSRGAEGESIELIKMVQERHPKLGGIFHSFTGNALQFRQIIEELQWFVGINGIVTYKSAMGLRQMCVNRIRKVGRTLQPEKTESDLALEPAYVRRSATANVGNLRPQSNPQFNRQLSENLRLLYASGLVLETDAPYLVPSNANRYQLPQVEGNVVNLPSTVVDTLLNLMDAVYDTEDYSGH